MTSSSTLAESPFITTEAMDSMGTDKIESYNALSQVPQDVLIKDDFSSYIDCKIEDLRSLALYSQLKSPCNKSGKVKPEYIRVYEKGFHNAVYFLEDFEEEHVSIIRSRVHGRKIYLDRSYNITKEAIHVVTSFYQTGEVLELRKILQNTVIELTKTTYDAHATSISNIQDEVVRYARMIIGYWIFHSSQMNSVPSTVVHVAYWMIKENIDYEL